MIPTDRVVVDDGSLEESVRQQLVDKDVTSIRTVHVESSNPSHLADRTRDGHLVEFSVNGASASVVI